MHWTVTKRKSRIELTKPINASLYLRTILKSKSVLIRS